MVVTAGVGNGDWIVTAGVHKLIPGQVVRPYDAGRGVDRPTQRALAPHARAHAARGS